MKKSNPTKDQLLQQDHVRAKVAEHAYYIAQSEGFPHGRDLIHWLQAEEHVITTYFQDAGHKVAEAGKKFLNKAKGNGKPSKPSATAVVTTTAKPAPKPAAPKPAAKSAPKPAPKAAAAKAAPAKKTPAKPAAKKK